MPRDLLKAFLAGSMMFLVPTSEVIASDFRVAAIFGYGNTTAKETTNSASEAPMGLAFHGDYALSSRHILGAEHQRSLGFTPFSTGVSFTGLTFKWYFWTPVPASHTDFDKIQIASIHQVNLSPYVGTGMGFGQSSILGSGGSIPDVNIVGLYASVKLGTDMPLWDRFGFRFEASFARTLLGNGTIQTFSGLLGMYAYF